MDPIEQYGLIGNLRTCALVGVSGSVDFFCYPRFDSPSIFLKLLDAERGGYFSVRPVCAVDDGDDLTGATCVPDGAVPATGAKERAASMSSSSRDDTPPPPPVFTSRQQYFPQSNVLLTKFLSESAVGQITDFMPLSETGSAPSGWSTAAPSSEVVLPWLVRHVQVIRGTITYEIKCQPAFNYARSKHSARFDLDHNGQQRVLFDCAEIGLVMDLRVVCGVSEHCAPVFGNCKVENLSLNDEPGDNKWNITQEEKMLGPGATMRVTLREGEFLFVVLREEPHISPSARENDFIHQVAGARSTRSCIPSTASQEDKRQQIHHCISAMFDPPFTVNLMQLLLRRTFKYWAQWLSQCTYRGRWQENVARSALTLKLLTYAPTGAVVAAPTFGLPEHIGGVRNWDYRYSWVRDSSFTVYALLRIGFKEEAVDYWRFMEELCSRDINADGSLSIMYSIDGRTEVPETVLDHLAGYRNSTPVRIGNAAQSHLQLDIYGELMDAAYLFNKFGAPISYDMWCILRRLVNYVCDNWHRPDMSIWETRGQPRHFLYSKVMCWVAIDRGLRLSEKRTLPCPDRLKWMKLRDEIYEQIMEQGYSQKRKAFVQSFGSEQLDSGE